MKKIDEIMPKLGFLPALIITIVFGIVFQLTGDWKLMLFAGALGALFVRRIRIAFLVGFFGIGIAWSFLFIYLVVTAQAMDVANFFIALLGLEGLGAVVIIVSVLIGALLGGFGAVLGRALYEFIDEFIQSKSGEEKGSAHASVPSEENPVRE